MKTALADHPHVGGGGLTQLLCLVRVGASDSACFFEQPIDKTSFARARAGGADSGGYEASNQGKHGENTKCEVERSPILGFSLGFESTGLCQPCME